MEKEHFKEYCDRNSEVPLFLSYDWITSIAEDHEWGVILSGDENDLKGFFLYFIKKKYGFKRILQPPLTPYLGPWINYPEGQKQAQRYGYEKKVMEELIERLPPYDEFILNFHPSIVNWLPFYWKGFLQRSRGTYRIGDPSDLDHIFESFKSNIRGAIRKGEHTLDVRSSESIDELYDLKLEDCRMKGVSPDHGREYLRAIDATLSQKGKRKILHAVDDQNVVRGAVYLVFGPSTCYYLIGAVEPGSKKEGTMSLLVWKGIQEAAQRGMAFDFEGSIMESIERFFRSFGTTRVPYHRIEKTPSTILRAKSAVKRVFVKG